MKHRLTYLVIALLISACQSNPHVPTVIHIESGSAHVEKNRSASKTGTAQQAPLTSPSTQQTQIRNAGVQRQSGEERVESMSLPTPTLKQKPSTASGTMAQLALVIGNSKYEYRPLRNPKNDAKMMANVLRQTGFEVILKTDLNYGEMKRIVRQFGQRLAASKGVGLFYFAGHGVQIKKNNYLVPINNDHISDEIDVQNGAIDVDEIVQRMEQANNGLNIVILDACRDNPFRAENFSRSLGRGLARTQIQADGMLIAYATSPNKTASDGLKGGNNGLYTQYLIEAIQTPGLKIEGVFKRVRQTVKTASSGEQVPWYNASLSGDFCFGGC
jgi:hypothetical protein